MPIKGDINTLAGIGMTNNRVGGKKRRRKKKYVRGVFRPKANDYRLDCNDNIFFHQGAVLH